MNTTDLKRTDLPGWHQSRMHEGRVRRVWQVNKIAARLIRQNGGRIVLYRDLPVEARHAIAFYMAVDGEAWECPKSLFEQRMSTSWMTQFKRTNRFFVSRYGDRWFGYVEVPAPQLIAAVWNYQQQFPDGNRFVSFDEYHRWYLSDGGACSHGTSVWPVILNDDGDDDGTGLFQDGWHRFHAYVASGVKTIPCIWYPQSPTSSVELPMGTDANDRPPPC